MSYNWILYDHDHHSVQEVTSEEVGIPYRIRVLRTQKCLLFKYHKGELRLEPPRNAIDFRRIVSNDILAIHVGEEYEFEKLGDDHQKLKLTLERMREDPEYKLYVSSYFDYN